MIEVLEQCAIRILAIADCLLCGICTPIVLQIMVVLCMLQAFKKAGFLFLIVTCYKRNDHYHYIVKTSKVIPSKLQLASTCY